MERIKVTVQELLPVREFAGRSGTVHAHSFKATDGKKYELFENAEIATKYFVVGAELDIDHEFKSQQTDNGIFEHNYIKQLYDNGEPQMNKKGGGGGGGFNRRGGRSPEDNASIEGQVAIKEAGMAIREKATVPDDVANLYWDWIRQRIKGVATPPAPAPAAKTQPAAAPAKTTPPPAQKTATDAAKPVTKPAPAASSTGIPTVPKITATTKQAIKDLQADTVTTNRELIERCRTNGWTDVKAMDDLTEPQGQSLIRWLESKRNEPPVEEEPLF